MASFSQKASPSVFNLATAIISRIITRARRGEKKWRGKRALKAGGKKVAGKTTEGIGSRREASASCINLSPGIFCPLVNELTDDYVRCVIAWCTMDQSYSIVLLRPSTSCEGKRERKINRNVLKLYEDASRQQQQQQQQTFV